MNYEELAERIQQGFRPTVVFLEGASLLEGYAEPNMRAVIVGARKSAADVVQLMMDFEPFDEFNKAFESANYYDKQQVPRLTAREAGFYKPQMHCYVMATDAVPTHFEILSDAQTQLIERYGREKQGQESYVAWLERMVLQQVHAEA